MVIVTVTEYNGIDSRRVDAQNFRILYNCIRLSRIKEKLMLFCFNIDAQSMLCDTVFIHAGVFYKCDDLHSVHLIGGFSSR